jgi:hypothetical protein
MSSNLLDEAVSEAFTVKEDKLDAIRDRIKDLRSLDAQITDLEETLKDLNKQRRELLYDALPTMFMNTGVGRVDILPEGNLPGYIAKLEDHYHAVLQSNWPEERRQAALKWINKHRLGDLIKTTITMEFGLGQDKIVKAVLKALKAVKVLPTVQQAIPWPTLTAMVKERYRAGNPLSDEDLHTLGASVNKVVKITQIREK